MSITWKALQSKEFLGNLLKMSVLPCCPHNPASSVSAMLNETNFRGVTLEWRTEHEPPNFQHPMSQKSKINKLDVMYKDLNISPDNWTDLTVTMCAGSGWCQPEQVTSGERPGPSAGCHWRCSYQNREDEIQLCWLLSSPRDTRDSEHSEQLLEKHNQYQHHPDGWPD